MIFVFAGLSDLGVDSDVAVDEGEEGHDPGDEELLPSIADDDVGRVLHDARSLVVVALEIHSTNYYVCSVAQAKSSQLIFGRSGDRVSTRETYTGISVSGMSVVRTSQLQFWLYVHS